MFVQKSRYSKMEKADILEMTVAYLQTMYRCPSQTVVKAETLDAAGSSRFAAGYRQCAVEVARYLATSSGASDGTVDAVQPKLMRHLTAVLQSKILRQPDDDDQLFPVPTSFPPEPETVTRSCDSSDSLCAGRVRVSSTVSSTRFETGSAMSSSELVVRKIRPSSAPTPPRCRDWAVVRQSAVGPPSIADRDGPSRASAGELDLQRARSADSCVWRPW